MKYSKGITMVALIVTVVIMLIIMTVTIEVGKNMIRKAVLEDLKTDMLLLQSQTKIISEKNKFGEGELVGTQIDLSSNNTTYTIEGKQYTIPDRLMERLRAEEAIAEARRETIVFYILTNEIAGVDTDSQKFYVVNYETGEIYYSQGYVKNNRVYFTLTELQGL